MNRDSIQLPPADSELVQLVELMCDGAISPAERDRLELLLENDRDAKLFYIAYLDLHAHMQWMMREDWAGEEGSGFRGQGSEEVASGQWLVASESDMKSQNPDIPKSQIPNLPSLAPNLPSPVSIILDDSTSPSPLSSLPFYISHPFVFSNLFALLVIGLGALGAWFYQIDIPHQVARTDRQSVPSRNISESEKFETVGRITGMVDVKWADINTSTERNNNVPLGRKYALSSGLMEITYDTGAKVILQGPCTYKVDSRDGGYLSIGKLTARLEKKRSEVRGQGPEKVASGQWSVASESNSKSQNPEIPKSPISNPSSSPAPHPQPLTPVFAVRTPTAVVTDLGTEFGVEVKSDKSTAVCVARGVVEVTRDSHAGNSPIRERLVAGEAIYLSSSPATAPQRMNSRLLRMTLAPDLKAALHEVCEGRKSQKVIRPIGLIASAYHCVRDSRGKLMADNDRELAFHVATDGVFGRGDKNEGPRSSFDTAPKGLGIGDKGLEEKNTDRTLRKGKSKSVSTSSKSESTIANPSQFVGLRYGQAVRFDRIKVFLGRQMGDGGNWAEMPRLFILKQPIDTDRTPPEQDSAHWKELPLRPLAGMMFSPEPSPNPGLVIEIPLTGFSFEDRTGYGWALGGVPGNGPGDYLSITELRAYSASSKNSGKGGDDNNKTNDAH